MTRRPDDNWTRDMHPTLDVQPSAAPERKDQKWTIVLVLAGSAALVIGGLIAFAKLL